jgi:signal transduction histidine kinase/DNA-binding NarL/FixJ family response regulator
MRILLIEDNDDDVVLIRQMLSASAGETFKLEWVDRMALGTEKLTRARPDAILLDLSLPDSSGLATYEKLHAAAPDVATIVLSGLDDNEIAVNAVRLGAQDFLVKGRFDQNLLIRSLRYAVERKRAEKRILAQQQRLAALHEINSALTSTLDPEAVLKFLIDKADMLLPRGAGLIWLIDEQSGVLERAASWNVDENQWWHRMIDNVPPLVQTMIESAEPVAVRNMQMDPRVLNKSFFAERRIVSCLGLPLRANGASLGVLVLLTREEHEFTDEEVQSLKMFAGQAAIAVHNSRLYKMVKEQAKELEKANKMTADFSAMIGHDLRSPLTHIIGVADMIETELLGPVTEEQRDWLKKIGMTGRNLVNMVNDFLDVSKLESGHINLNNEDFRIGDLIVEVLKNHRVSARKENIELIHSIDPKMPMIHADRRRLEQVLDNLLSNAIKFTGKEGRIEVIGSLGNSGKLKIQVKDSGVGIPAAELDQLFQKYRQATNIKSSKEKGTGLGLVICKMIVNAHNGQITVESKEGKGTTFSILLPLHS